MLSTFFWLLSALSSAFFSSFSRNRECFLQGISAITNIATGKRHKPSLLWLWSAEELSPPGQPRAFCWSHRTFSQTQRPWTWPAEILLMIPAERKEYRIVLWPGFFEVAPYLFFRFAKVFYLNLGMIGLLVTIITIFINITSIINCINTTIIKSSPLCSWPCCWGCSPPSAPCLPFCCQAPADDDHRHDCADDGDDYAFCGNISLLNAFKNVSNMLVQQLQHNRLQTNVRVLHP